MTTVLTACLDERCDVVAPASTPTRAGRAGVDLVADRRGMHETPPC